MASANPRGDKRDALIAAGKVGHRVLIFGQTVFGAANLKDLQHLNASVEIVSLPNDIPFLKRLINYSLVILDYEAFNIGSIDASIQEVFEKQMEEALSTGTIFCFVHYNNQALDGDFNPYSDIPKNQAAQYRATQIGFRFLEYLKIIPHRIDHRILSGSIKRNVFKVFLDKWGASHNYFGLQVGGRIDDSISSLTEDVFLGFTLNLLKGKLIYLPFQRNFTIQQDVNDGLNTLIDCLLTYITESLIEIPEWASTPFFKEEYSIRNECSELERLLEEKRALLKPFEEAKGILFQSKYTLESTVPTFLQNLLSVETFRDEKYKEDFWILNAAGEKAIIAEVKSAVKGFKKSMIYDLYNHRDENNLDESFPALLVANCNLQAGSWKDKDQVINKQDYQIAAQNNILIIRAEDLVRLWELVREGTHDTEEIYQLFLTGKGWLQVDQDLNIHTRT